MKKKHGRELLVNHSDYFDKFIDSVARGEMIN